MTARQSRMPHPRDAGDGRGELSPAFALLAENVAARFRNCVVTAAASSGALDPPSDDPAAIFHAVQQWVERRDVEVQDTLRARPDLLADLIAVLRFVLEHR